MFWKVMTSPGGEEARRWARGGWGDVALSSGIVWRRAARGRTAWLGHRVALMIARGSGFQLRREKKEKNNEEMMSWGFNAGWGWRLKSWWRYDFQGVTGSPRVMELKFGLWVFFLIYFSHCLILVYFTMVSILYALSLNILVLMHPHPFHLENEWGIGEHAGQGKKT